MCRLGTILNCVWSSKLKLFLQGMTSTGYRKEIKLIRRGVITFFIVSFWTFRKWITIVFIKRSAIVFLYDCLKKLSFLNFFSLINKFTIINKGSSLTIVNEESPLTIVNGTTNFIKTAVFWKKLHATLSNVVLYEGSSLTIFNEGSSLTILDGELYNNDHFANRSFLKTSVSFTFFVVVFITKRSFLKKNENDPTAGLLQIEISAWSWD